jgi:hypothetical protein
MEKSVSPSSLPLARLPDGGAIFRGRAPLVGMKEWLGFLGHSVCSPVQNLCPS